MKSFVKDIPFLKITIALFGLYYFEFTGKCWAELMIHTIFS